MKRYRVRSKATGMSLFPFLAVLICTMGALIVLLVLVVQMARVDASEPPRAPDNRVALDTESYKYRFGLLQHQHGQLDQDVQRNSAELEHLEQHIRELERRWKDLVAAATDLQSRVRRGPEDVQAARNELARTQAAIETVKQKLATARQRLAEQPPVYAIVPYDGPNGTRRQPVYLECTADGVTIQPDQVHVSVTDLDGPLGAGNPLDAALRAIRKYQGQLQGTTTSNAYPLLIVRPDGAEAYALARAAMRVWDDEFGYELIDAEKRLQFPPADARRAELLRKVITDARSRQAILISAMPSRFQDAQGGSGYVGAARGGVAPPSVTGSSQPTRTGGFGRGGDTRFAEGQATRRHVAGPAPTSRQPTDHTGRSGAATGKPGATRGAGGDPLAKKRGRNWGLPQAADDGTGIIRPIRIACLIDRLILLPDRDRRQTPTIILINDSMVDEIDVLVGKIWDQVDRWGIAVAGGYWKPVLHVDVAPGADERFVELQTLLLGSGLEVKRNHREKTRAPTR